MLNLKIMAPRIGAGPVETIPLLWWKSRTHICTSRLRTLPSSIHISINRYLTNTIAHSEVLSVDHETVTIWQNITLCPGHDYALSFEIVAAGCVGGAIWQAFAAGQTLGTVSDYVPPSGGAQVGPFFMSAIPAGPTGTGTPGSADYTTYQYDATGLNVYTQVALTFQCPSTSYGLGITELDNFSMYQTD